MDTRALGLAVIIAGVLAVVVGALIWAGALNWFGRLPGDIRFESGNTRVYIPITTMILVSIAVSLLAWAARRLL